MTETVKLYYLDSHIFDFEATVLNCEPRGENYAVTLDKTAFFPEGGGQSADTGRIGDVRVLDVQEEKGEIIHFCDGALIEGAKYHCALEKEKRWRKMQNHSGEHVLSGIVHSMFGYENVGFHLGDEEMTVDFSGELSDRELSDIEQCANLVVRENHPIYTLFPAPEELSALSYRSKLELTENVRIVVIEGVDSCACCAPHVKSTGEIGLIKILSSMRHRGGMRLTLICGMDAYDDYCRRQHIAERISHALSLPQSDIAGGVERMLQGMESQKLRIGALSLELARLKAETFGETDGNICVFEELLDTVAVRELVNALKDKCGGYAAVFQPEEDGAYRYTIGSGRVNLRTLAPRLNTALNGRGGGSATMIQGRVNSTQEEICKFVKSDKV